MSGSNFFTGGMAIVVLCVVMVIGGALFMQTYMVAQSVTGAATVYTNWSTETCEQYLPNESTICGGLGGGSITTTNWSGITHPEYAYDKDWTTAATDFINDSIESVRFTYIIPDNTTAVNIQVKFDNSTGVTTTTNYTLSGANCRNSTSFYTFRLNVTANVSYTAECINDSGVYTVLGTIDMPNESFRLFEQQAFWTINKSHGNYTTSSAPIVNSVFGDMGTTLTSFVSLIPILALAIVGAFAIAHFMQRTSA